MATLEGLIRRTRLELADVKEPFYETFTASGRGARFDLKAEHIESFFLYPEGEPENQLIEGTDGDFTIDRRAGALTFHEPPEEGARFVVEGDRGRLFSDEEMEIFVREAFGLHTRGRNPRPQISSLPDVEVLLVAILAQIEALWVLKASSAYDINVHAPEGMFIPRGQRFQQLNVLLQEAQARYKELSGAMGVGLYAVEMFTLRRVSRMTGRYVPVYIDREVDDTRPPQRVFPNIGNQFAELPEATIEKITLQLVQGRPFERTFEMMQDDSPFPLTDQDELQARLLRTPYSAHLMRDVLPQFTVTRSEHEITLSLTSEQTSKLESTASYHWTFSWRRNGEEVLRLEGPLLVEATLPLKSVHVRFT